MTDQTKRIKDLEALVLDLQKRSQWAREDADMRKIDLDKMTNLRDEWQRVAYHLAEHISYTDRGDDLGTEEVIAKACTDVKFGE